MPPAVPEAISGDLGDQLPQDGVGEGVVVLCDHHEGAGTADDVVVVVLVETGLERENRQAVDADTGSNRLVAGDGDRTAAIVGAVAGDVDDPAPALIGIPGKQRHCMIDGAADRGAAAKQLPRRTLDGGGENGCRFLVTDPCPSDHLDLQRRPGPLRHGDCDRLLRAGADGLQHATMAEGGDVAALLQLEARLIDAARGVDREHELEVDRALCHGRTGHREREHQHRNERTQRRPLPGLEAEDHRSHWIPVVNPLRTAASALAGCRLCVSGSFRCLRLHIELILVRCL